MKITNQIFSSLYQQEQSSNTQKDKENDKKDNNDPIDTDIEK